MAKRAITKPGRISTLSDAKPEADAKLAKHEYVRATSHGSRFGATAVAERDFGNGLKLPAIEMEGFNPSHRSVVSIALSHEAAETMTRVLALALGWPSIPGE